MRERLSAVLSSLDESIELMKACEFTDTARLLGMAKLDLQMRLYGIGDDELRKFSQMLDEKIRSGGEAALDATAPTAPTAKEAVGDPVPCPGPERRRTAARAASRAMPN